jgi:hypothetical protein
MAPAGLVEATADAADIHPASALVTVGSSLLTADAETRIPHARTEARTTASLPGETAVIRRSPA